jgi:predicted RecB family nuclease
LIPVHFDTAHHLDDVAIQYRVVSRSGLDLASVCLAHVNRGYVFDGQSIDAKRFFKIRNLTRRVVKLQPKLTFQLRSEFTALAMPTAPDIAPGRHCADPVTCEFYDRCNPLRPDDHVGFLPRLHASAMEELDAMGVQSIKDIPDDFELTEIQRRAAACVKTGNTWFSPELPAELAKLEYPLYFLDFETVNPAIPRFAGMHPYDHLPFQFSLHIEREPGAEPEHHEFLADDRTDLRSKFIASLCDVVGERGSIVVYNQQFESARLSDLASWFPEFCDRIKNIQSRLWDLLPIIRNHVYHPAFAGSYSLKAVLPALVPEMTYEGMTVADGVDAGRAWESLIRAGGNPEERNRLRSALLVYCEQDTFALLRLLDKLRLATTSRC